MNSRCWRVSSSPGISTLGKNTTWIPGVGGFQVLRVSLLLARILHEFPVLEGFKFSGYLYSWQEYYMNSRCWRVSSSPGISTLGKNITWIPGVGGFQVLRVSLLLARILHEFPVLEGFKFSGYLYSWQEYYMNSRCCRVSSSPGISTLGKNITRIPGVVGFQVLRVSLLLARILHEFPVLEGFKFSGYLYSWQEYYMNSRCWRVSSSPGISTLGKNITWIPRHWRVSSSPGISTLGKNITWIPGVGGFQVLRVSLLLARILHEFPVLEGFKFSGYLYSWQEYYMNSRCWRVSSSPGISTLGKNITWIPGVGGFQVLRVSLLLAGILYYINSRCWWISSSPGISTLGKNIT